jgi:hypothetical protein
MRLLFIFFLSCVMGNFCKAQECWSLDHGWIPCSTSDTLIDKFTGNYYVVVRPERCIKAFDPSQKIIWETDPWQDKQLSKMNGLSWTYLNPDSIFIDTIDFAKTEYMGGNKSIVVYFSDRIVGALDKKTGEFYIMGEN